MPLKQSAFDFDNEPEQRKPGEKPVAVNVQDIHEVQSVSEDQLPMNVPALEVIDETVREIEFVVAQPAAKLKPGTEKKSTRGRMKLADMNSAADLIEVPEDELLFQKRYYSIGAVADMFKVNISLIRFWENEFDILKPKKNGKGDRLFRPEDVKNLKMIYQLLRERKYTIEGAKDFLKKNKKAEEHFAVIGALEKMKAFLHELKANF